MTRVAKARPSTWILFTRSACLRRIALLLCSKFSSPFFRQAPDSSTFFVKTKNAIAELDHIINALIRKRAEIAGQIECHQDALNQFVVDLDNVDHTLRLFARDIDLEEIEPKPVPPRSQAFKGEMKRLILDAMKRSKGAPIDSRELT